MGGFLGGGGGSQTSTSTSTVKLPAYIEQGGQDLFNQAQDLAAQPYVPYTGARIAPLSTNQQAGINLAGSSYNAFQPYIDAGASLAGAVPGVAGQAQAGGDYALAMGDWAANQAANATQYGDRATALGDYALQFGDRASQAGDYALSQAGRASQLGDHALGYGERATQFGDLAAGQAGWAGDQAQYVNQLAQIAAQQGFGAEQRAWDVTSPFGAEEAAHYMNPYARQVIDVAADNMWERYGQRLNQLGGEAVAQGALGGARHGIENAELGESTIQDIGNTYLAGLNQAYNTAYNQYAGDRNARLAGINTGLAGTNVGLGAANAALGAGQLGLGAGGLYNQAGQLNLGAGGLANQVAQTNLGAGQLGIGAGQLDLGAGQLANQTGQLNLGAGQLGMNAAQVGNQAGQLGIGAGNLALGQGQLYNQAAGTMGNLGALTQNAYTQGLQNLLATGGIQQQLQQQQLSLAYQDFLNQQQWPYQQLNFAQGILSGTPYSRTMNTLSTAPGGDSTGGLLGLGTTALGLFGGGGGSFLGGGGGGLTSSPANWSNLGISQLGFGDTNFIGDI